MMRATRLASLAATVALTAALGACGGDDGDGGNAVESPAGQPGGSASGGPTVNLEASDFKFAPNPLKLTKGQAVTITMKNTGNSIHNFQSLDFKLDKDVEAGKTVTFEFTPSAAGTFEYVCKYHTAQGMKGNLVIS